MRRYVLSHGFRIEEEDMVEEDGKYYPMMRLVHKEKETESITHSEEPYKEWEYLYGRKLLEKKHPVLKAYLERELRIREGILAGLKGKTGERIEERVREIKREAELARRALECYQERS